MGPARARLMGLEHLVPSAFVYVSPQFEDSPIMNDTSMRFKSYLLALPFPSYSSKLYYKQASVTEGMLRRYATIATKPPSRLQARGKNPLGLDHVSQVAVVTINQSDNQL